MYLIYYCVQEPLPSVLEGYNQQGTIFHTWLQCSTIISFWRVDLPGSKKLLASTYRTNSYCLLFNEPVQVVISKCPLRHLIASEIHGFHMSRVCSKVQLLPSHFELEYILPAHFALYEILVAILQCDVVTILNVALKHGPSTEILLHMDTMHPFLYLGMCISVQIK